MFEGNFFDFEEPLPPIRLSQKGKEQARLHFLTEEVYLENIQNQMERNLPQKTLKQFINKTREFVELVEFEKSNVVDETVIDKQIVRHIKYWCRESSVSNMNIVCYMDFKKTKMFLRLKKLWRESGQGVEAFLMDVMYCKEFSFHYVFRIRF